jgi:Ras-related protein Rab-6A
LAKNIYCNSSNYRLQLWDTAGQERFKSLIPAYLKNTNCAVCIFDVTSRDSFKNLKNWIQIFEDNRPEGAATIILGNKIDLPRRVSQAEAKEQARKLGMSYFEVSARTAENLEKFFQCAIEVIN